MKKRYLVIGLAVLILVGIVVVQFIRDYVPVVELSGTYVSASDSSIRLVFDEGFTVTLYENNVATDSGTYSVSGNNLNFLFITFESAGWTMFHLDEGRSIIHYNVEGQNAEGNTINTIGDVAFIKEN